MILGMCVRTIVCSLSLCWRAREMRASVAPSIPSACLGWKSFDFIWSFTLSVCSFVDVAARDSSKVFAIHMWRVAVVTSVAAAASGEGVDQCDLRSVGRVGLSSDGCGVGVFFAFSQDIVDRGAMPPWSDAL